MLVRDHIGGADWGHPRRPSSAAGSQAGTAHRVGRTRVLRFRRCPGRDRV